MTSVPLTKSSVWQSLGLPDMSTGTSRGKGAFTSSHTEVKSLPRKPARPQYPSFSTGEALKEGEQVFTVDERDDPARVRSAWLSPTGLAMAYATASSPRPSAAPDTPTSRPAVPLSLSPRHEYTALDELSQAATPPRPTQRVPPAREMRRGIDVCELVDAVRRVVYQLKSLHNNEDLPGWKRTPIAGRKWRASVEAMRVPLRDTALSVEAAVDPLYKLPSLKDKTLLRADDATWPLVFLLQTISLLRDTVAGAACLHPNFFDDKDLDKYTADVTWCQNSVLFAAKLVVDLVRPIEGSPDSPGSRFKPLELSTTDKRDLAVACLAELVPNSTSRRFWISSFGATTLEVDSNSFGEAVKKMVSELLPGAVASITQGITKTVSSRGGHVSLCSYSCIFGSLSIADALDTLSVVGVSNVTYSSLVSPLIYQSPPQSRYKPRAEQSPGQARYVDGVASELLNRAKAGMRDACLNCASLEARIVGLEEELNRAMKAEKTQQSQVAAQPSRKASMSYPLEPLYGEASYHQASPASPSVHKVASSIGRSKGKATVDLSAFVAQTPPVYTPSPSPSPMPARSPDPSPKSFDDWMKENLRA